MGHGRGWIFPEEGQTEDTARASSQSYSPTRSQSFAKNIVSILITVR